MIATRTKCPAIGRGVCQGIATDHPAVFAHRLRLGAEMVIVVHNLGGSPCQVTLDVDAASCQLSDLITAVPVTPVSTAPLLLELAPYGYQWLSLACLPPAAPAPIAGPTA